MSITQDSIKWALTHLRTIGDSDLFPWAAEIEAFCAMQDDVVKIVTTTPISDFKPCAARRFMVPKDDVSFRRATQLNPLDSLILTSAIREFGGGIEARRVPPNRNIVFSYRFAPQPDGWLYDKRQDWTQFWTECQRQSNHCGAALVLDISDFYNQRYHHTVENQLIESGFPNQVNKWIIGLLESLTAKVSRGIPVGPHAAHLLAEASLIPLDNALISRRIRFIRYVDDIVVFGVDQSECRRHIYTIADALDKQQRLILNKSKTRFLSPAELHTHASDMIADSPINATESALLKIIRRYSGGNPYATITISQIAPADLLSFTQRSIEQILSEYLSQSPVNFIRLRWFLRRLIQVGHSGGVGFCLNNLDQLVPALSDVCHYFLSVAVSGTHNITDVATQLLTALNSELLKSNEYFRLCILSLFARNGAFDHFHELVPYFDHGGSNVQREVILASRLGAHADWLRELKEHASGLDPWSRNAFLLAAKSLPIEERSFFAKSWESNSACEDILLKWIKSK
jgi:hypothetical protein